MSGEPHPGFEGWKIINLIGKDGIYTVGIDTTNKLIRIRGLDGQLETIEGKLTDYQDMKYIPPNYLRVDWAALQPEIKLPPITLGFWATIRWWINNQ